MDDKSTSHTSKDPSAQSETADQNAGSGPSDARRRVDKTCNVKDVFPLLEVPQCNVHVIKKLSDWDPVAETFLKATCGTKVKLLFCVGEHKMVTQTWRTLVEHVAKKLVCGS